MNATYLKRLTELVIVAYVTTFLGLITAAGFDIFDLAAVKAAAASAIPAALVALYGALAKGVGDKNSPLAAGRSNS